MRKCILWAIALILCYSMSQAQSLQVYGGLSTPRNNFISLGQEGYADYAERGYSFGAKADFKVLPLIFLETSLGVFHNSIAPFASNIPESQGLMINGAMTATPYVTNIPLLVHAKIKIFPSKKDKDFDLWWESAVGVDRRYISPMQYSATQSTFGMASQTFDVVSSFNPTTSFAKQTGIGVTFNGQISIGFVWYDLGSNKVTGTSLITNANSGTSAKQTFNVGKLPQKIRCFRVGYCFK